MDPTRSFLAALLFLLGCGGPAPVVPTEEPGEGVVLPDGSTFTRAAMLDAVAVCVDREQRTFRDRAVALDEAADPETARARFHDAMASWERLEMMQIGPTALATMPGGDGVRDQIYAWPLLGTCRIDEHLVAEDDLDGVASLGIHTRGLAATEYLLFHEGPSSCEPGSTVHTATAGLGDTLPTRRWMFASALAADVRLRADDLVRRWDPGGDDFFHELAHAGRGSRHYPRAQYALNSISDALFYIDHVAKDLKVGEPAGLRVSCPTETCTDRVESRFAGRSRAHLRENLVAFGMLFAGCGNGTGTDFSGLGFDDLLFAVGAPAVADRVLAAWRGALDAIDAIEEADLADAIDADLASVDALHVALRALTDLLRTELVSTLDLELPTAVEGDND